MPGNCKIHLVISRHYLSSLQRELCLSLIILLSITFVFILASVQTLLAACKVTILHCDLYTLVPVALNVGAIKSKLACHLPKWFHNNNVKELRPGSLKGLATANSITPDRTTSKMCLYPCLTTLLHLSNDSLSPPIG